MVLRPVPGSGVQVQSFREGPVFSMSDNSHRLRIALGCLLFLVCTGSNQTIVQADEIVLKNGLRLSGELTPLAGLTQRMAVLADTPFPVTRMLMIEDGIKRTYVSTRQASKPTNVANFQTNEVFRLKQQRKGQQRMVASVGVVQAPKPFDDFGRRTVKLTTPNGSLEIIQGITRITPSAVTIEGITHKWSFAMATSNFPLDRIDAIIRKTIDSNDPEDRMSIARFYLQGENYLQSRRELEQIKRDFPEYKAVAEKVIEELLQAQAQQLLAELRRRQAAGQHELVQVSLTKFPLEQLDPGVIRQVQEISDGYVQQKKQIEKTLFLLEELQAKLSSEHQSKVATMRLEVAEHLRFDTLTRLAPFISFSDDESIPVVERLALAYSGWVLGNANAITDLDQTIRIWDARYLVVEYLRSDDEYRREEIVKLLKNTEGMSPNRLLQMVSQLPLPILSDNLDPGVAQTIELNDASEGRPATRYSVVLPTEYNPHRSYPLVVALRPAERSVNDTLLWWAGNAEKPGRSQRHGSIVVAPEYLNEGDSDYAYNVAAHHAVLNTIRDVRKRFQVDSNRIFLAGHGAGANAALDIGMSHPHHFAGLISVNGISKNFCQWYWKNCEHLPIYFVAGELDRALLTQNAGPGKVNEMMLKGIDVMYTEYVGRGYESYHEEIGHIFDWMDALRRARFPKEVEAQILRPTDNEFYWVQASGFPDVVSRAPQVLLGKNRTRRVSPMRLSARVSSANAILLQSGARQHILSLSPELVNYDRQLLVRHRGKYAFRGFVESDMTVTLEDLRQRGDRQRIYTAQLAIK